MEHKHSIVLVFFQVVAACAIAAGVAVASGVEPDNALLCHVPAYSNPDSVQMNATDADRDTLVTEGRCFLRCTTEKFEVLPSPISNSNLIFILGYCCCIRAESQETKTYPIGHT